MTSMPRVAIVLFATLAAGAAWGQSKETPWQYSASMSYYDMPKLQDYWNPVVTADRDVVHLEGRYNFLSFDTGSFWAGYNFTFGKKWTFDLTAMFGIVVGSVQGVGPGYELSLKRDWFLLTSEGEYVFDIQPDVDNTSYGWTEISGSPADWCRLGFVLQLTDALNAERNVQGGLVVAFSYKNFELEADWLDPNRNNAETYILVATLNF
jgi:hypothetical protein